MARVFSSMSNRNSDRGHFCLISDFNKNASTFLIIHVCSTFNDNLFKALYY